MDSIYSLIVEVLPRLLYRFDVALCLPGFHGIFMICRRCRDAEHNKLDASNTVGRGVLRRNSAAEPYQWGWRGLPVPQDPVRQPIEGLDTLNIGHLLRFSIILLSLIEINTGQWQEKERAIRILDIDQGYPN
jgi:hypothetical protein